MSASNNTEKPLPADDLPAALTPGDLSRLREHAREIRKMIVTMVTEANSGHVGGSLSSTELLVLLYQHVMRHDPSRPDWPERDRYIQSKGHCTPVLYATLADCGYFDKEVLKTFRQPGSILQGHPYEPKVPGVEASTGTLGLGLSTACGRALGARLKGLANRTFVLCGDGEQQEGQIWEAAMFAAKYHLDKLIAFTDRNRLQTDGNTEKVMPLEPLADKWKAFGWHVQTVDGHHYEAILEAITNSLQVKGQPHMIILDTIKGKGVSFMENEASWHGTPPDRDQWKQAMEELNNGN